jgi:hypothetical protein
LVQIWGPQFINATRTANKTATVLLGFNEPDLQWQFAAKDAASLWPSLEETGI